MRAPQPIASERPLATASASSRRLEKSSSAFRTISEVAQDLDVPQHVLRFWETRFTQIRPLKRGGGRRNAYFYDPISGSGGTVSEADVTGFACTLI